MSTPQKKEADDTENAAGSSPPPPPAQRAAAAPRPRVTIDEITQMLENGIPEIFKWEDDDIALRAAAMNSRLPFDKMSSVELAAFHDLVDSKSSMALYIYIRNKILQMWSLEPNVELTKEAVYHELTPPYNSDRTLIRRIHAFFERYGFINFGCYHVLSAPPEMPKKKRIIIVGAGISGLIAFRQLKSFGFDVVLVEARNRKGGRVHTHKGQVSGVDVEIGAMIVMGLQGNPIVTLARQTPITLDRLNAGCTIYDHKGKPIDKRKDQLVEKAFNRMGDLASFIVHEKKVEMIDDEKLSLGAAYDNIMCLMELKLQRKRLHFWKSYEQISNKLQQTMEEMMIYKRTGELIVEKMKDLDANPQQFSSDLEKDILCKCYRRDLSATIKKYHQADERRKTVETALNNLKQLEPSEVFMKHIDRRILEFHFANLEYANGTQLKNISLKYWDQDDGNEFAGSHTNVREGYLNAFSALVDDRQIEYNHVVKEIIYNEQGVTVLASHSADSKVEEFRGDAVLVTLPLGVLKASISGGDTSAPTFSPPLPATKTAAIERLGFGSLNKVILIFKRIFWEEGVHFFGNVNQESNATTRGELFMFVSTRGKPVLSAFLAGAAANAEVPNEMLVGRAMRILGNIFGNACPASPVEAVVTLWHKDPFARGCYSYMAKEAEADDYDTLAEPVKALIADDKYEGPQRVFFAGEHTSRQHPATVHGAFLSGLRESGRIADTFYGCPYATPENDVVTLDDKDDEVEITLD